MECENLAMKPEVRANELKTRSHSKAGLTPNQKTEAYDEQWLLSKLASLARELGHLPIGPEIRLKARNDKDFPTDSTISTRLGNKAQMISKLAEFCRSNEGYQDVLAMCETGGKPDVAPQGDGTEDEQENGFVYLFKSGRYYKIGRSNSVGRREYELAIQMPEKLTLVHQIRTDDPAGIED